MEYYSLHNLAHHIHKNSISSFCGKMLNLWQKFTPSDTMNKLDTINALKSDNYNLPVCPCQYFGLYYRCLVYRSFISCWTITPFALLTSHQLLSISFGSSNPRDINSMNKLAWKLNPFSRNNLSLAEHWACLLLCSCVSPSK